MLENYYQCSKNIEKNHLKLIVFEKFNIKIIIFNLSISHSITFLIKSDFMLGNLNAISRNLKMYAKSLTNFRPCLYRRMIFLFSIVFEFSAEESLSKFIPLKRFPTILSKDKWKIVQQNFVLDLILSNKCNIICV